MQKTWSLFVLTDKENASLLSKVTQLTQQYKFQIADRHTAQLEQQHYSSNQYECIRLKLIGDGRNLASFNQKLSSLSDDYQRDIFLIQQKSAQAELIAFDMDSTLIQHEVIVEIAREVGIEKQVSDITESAMRGEIDFTESFIRRMQLLKGIDISLLDKINNRLKMTPGTEHVLKTLKAHNKKVAIISGGFTYFAQSIKDKFNLDYVFANELPIVNNKISGETGEKFIDAEAKASILKHLMSENSFQTLQTMAVGDGANDLLMLSTAGMGVSYHAKPLVQKQCQLNIKYSGMEAILFLLDLVSFH